jgi:poly(hydroxyalkanoate) depolymerase family esterase
MDGARMDYEKSGDSPRDFSRQRRRVEKITINLVPVDLGQIDLLVEEGFYSNRADLIRTAIRNQLALHAQVVQETVTRRALVLGMQHFSRQDLEAVRKARERLDIQVLGLASIAADVSPELARATIGSVAVLGDFTQRLPSRRQSPTVSANHARPNLPSSLFTGPHHETERRFSMHEAMALLRTRGPAEATAAIQRALRGEGARATNHRSDETVSTPVDAPLYRGKINEIPPRVTEQGRTDVEDRGHFSMHAYSNAAGRRQYRLYVPAGTASTPMPLVVMLHGCTQDADDFAAGTQMNALAERHRFLVAYPVQPKQANPSKCWNWFRPSDQSRERGEPSLIAGITREIIAMHDVDPTRVYVAGLSAGGAMAAIMISEYPDLYAAAGVHSGLAARCAHNLPSALAAMKGGTHPAEARRAQSRPSAPQRPMIVFHGDADATVHPSNAARIVRGFERQHDSVDEQRRSEAGRRDCTIVRLVSSSGADAELWTIHGAPHAWAGGSVRGSFTDASGPDASGEMLRFFLEHPQRP